MQTKDIPRVDEALTILTEMKIKAYRYLDLGCGNGEITGKVGKTVNAKEIYGADLDENALERAKDKGINVFALDLSKDKIPLDDNSVDLVTALEVVEHLVNPDHTLREVFRMLKPSGYALLSTPNLANWVNRITMLLGYQPYNAEVSTEILAGVPLRAYSFTKPSGHIRPYTLKAFTELLSHHGFKIKKISGAPGVYPKQLAFLDKILSKKKSLARRLVVLAAKSR